MRIGVNALYLIPGGVGGTEIYLRNLLGALAAIDRENEYVVFTNAETGRDLTPEAPNFVQARQAVRASFRPARILYEQLRLPAAARRARLDVLFNPGFTAPLHLACPSVTVFHDLQHKRHPEYFRWFDLPFWRFLLWASAHRSARLISVSQATADDVMRYYGKPSRVIHHGVEPAFFERGERREPKPYLLCVSTSHPHKNLERLLRVHASLEAAPELIIAGRHGFAARSVHQAAGEGVRFTGWIPREELYELYRCAAAFIHPSTFEGFGMPVLEAMAAGVPVACSDIRPLREIAGGMAVFFDPESDEAMRDAIVRVMRDGGPVKRAREHAACFTWERTARETLQELAAAVSRPRQSVGVGKKRE